MSPRIRSSESFGLPFAYLRRVIIRIYWLGLLIALIALIWPGSLLADWRLLPVVAALGILAGLVGPWLLDRYRKSRLYLLVLVLGASGLSILLHQTGGALSPFWNFYLVMMALVAALFPPRRAIPGIALVAAASLVPLFWHWDPDYLRHGFVSMVFFAFMAHFVNIAASTLTQERRQKDHLRRLAEVSRTATGLDLNATLQGAAENLVAATDAHAGIIFFVSQERVAPRVVVLSPSLYTESEFEAVHRFSLRPGEGLVGWVAEHGESIRTGNAQRDPRSVPVPGTEQVAESALVVPVRLDNRVTGVILLSRLGEDQFDEEDLNLVQIMADQTAVAVENARLYEEAKKRAARLFTLSEVTRASQSSLEPKVLLSGVEAELSRFFSFDCFAVTLFDAALPASQVLYQGGRIRPAETAGVPSEGESVATWLARENRGHWAPDLASRQQFSEDALLLKAGLRSVIRAPIWAEDRVAGVCTLAAEAAGAFTGEDADLFADIARVINLALNNARMFDEMQRLAATDPLTGLYNRRFFHGAWEDVSQRAQDGGASVSLLMIDINDFKGYNDRYGHVAGDQLLREVAQILQQQVRGSDVVARYGGDEFVILMPETGEEQARRVKERIERAVATRNALATDERRALVLDVGVESGRGAALERLLAKADQAMYQVKESADRRQLKAVVAASEQERQRLALQTVLSLAKIEEMKDAYTRGHSERLRDYAVEVGRELGLDEDQLQNIAYGAILHDIGKVAIPSHLLHKPGSLTPEETHIMRMHPVLGEAMIADVELLQGARPIIRHHQERYDGRTDGSRPGYPDGLSGEQIPLGARIIAVVDAFDAMTTDRPYRPGISASEALEELRRNADTQFDGRVVEVFERVLARVDSALG